MVDGLSFTGYSALSSHLLRMELSAGRFILFVSFSTAALISSET